MAKIKPLIDGNGIITYPITHVDAVIDPKGVKLGQRLSQIEGKLKNSLIVTLTNFDGSQGTCDATSTQIKEAMSEGKPVYVYEESFFKGYLLIQDCWGMGEDCASYVTFYDDKVYKFVIFETGKLVLSTIKALGIVVDDELDENSTHVLQNKTITQAVNSANTKLDEHSDSISQINTAIETLQEGYDRLSAPFIVTLNDFDGQQGNCTATSTEIKAAMSEGKPVYLYEANYFKGYLLMQDCWGVDGDYVSCITFFGNKIYKIVIFETGKLTLSAIQTLPITIDQELSETSSNAVENQVITNALKTANNTLSSHTESIGELSESVSALQQTGGDALPPFIKILAYGTERPETAESNGYYIYYNDEELFALYKYQNGTWTEQTQDILPKAYLVFENAIYLWKNAQMYETNVNMVNDIVKETIIDESNRESANPPTTAAVYNAINDAVSGVDEDDDVRLYPEHYGAQADGIDYYNWPLRCFGGTVEVAAADIQDTIYPAKVFAPSERIAFRYTYMPDFISSEQVVFNTTTNQFLLAITNDDVTTYYNKWDGDSDWENSFVVTRTVNKKSVQYDYRKDFIPYCGSSAEWNDEDVYDVYGVLVRKGTGLARTDTVYSDISPSLVSEGKLKRISYVFKGGEMVNILDTMTNDEKAINDCIRATKGNMRLHAGKIYFMLKTEATTEATAQYKDFSNFVTDGQGGTIFVRSTRTEAYNGETGGASTNSAFYFQGCSNGIVRNINIMAMRDRDNGAPGKETNNEGHRRFSSSCSRLIGFELGTDRGVTYATRDMRFENITMKGFYEDFYTHMISSTNIVFENFRSTEVCQNRPVSARHFTMNNFHVTQNGFCGDGMHIFYGGGHLKGMMVSNGVFDVNAPFTSVMLAFHGSSGEIFSEDTISEGVSQLTKVLPTGIHFNNVQIYGGRLLQSSSVVSSNTKWLHLRNCVITQKFERMLKTTDGYSFVDCDSIIMGTGANWTFENCIIHLRNAKMMEFSTDSSLTLAINNSTITSRDSRNNNQNEKLISGFTGTFITEGVKHNWVGQTGVDFTATTHEKINTALEKSSQIDSIRQELYGDEYTPDYVTDANGVYPLEATIGDYVRNAATGNIEVCTERAVSARLCLKCSEPPSSALSGTITIQTKTDPSDLVWQDYAEATIDIGAGAVATDVELAAEIKKAFTNAGNPTAFPVSGNHALFSILSKGGQVVGAYSLYTNKNPNGCIKITISDSTLQKYITFHTTTAISNSDGVSGDFLKYYTKGSIGAGDVLSAGSGLVDKVATIEEDHSVITSIRLWDGDSTQITDWAKGDYWYDSTNSLLKRHNGTSFDNVTDIVLLAYNNALYIWLNNSIHTITIS